MKKPSIIDNPGRFTSGIAGTDEFRLERGREREPGERTRRAVKLSAFACESATRTERGFDTKESAVYRLIGHIDSFSESQAKLDHLRELSKNGTRITFAQKEPSLREVIRFNHAAKELINLDQNISFNQLAVFITRMYESQHAYELKSLGDEARQNKLAWLNTATKAVLNGMRHELAYEQMLGELQSRGIDIDYDETTENDELKGVDYFVTLEGVRHEIDVKGSPQAVTKPRHVWSQVHYGRRSDRTMIDEFNNGFRIPHELTTKRADGVLADLQRRALAA